MKKSLLYLFAVVVMTGFFTACSSGDYFDSPDGWRGISKTYDSVKTLALKMDSATIPVNGKSVIIDATSAEKASVTLNNILPENKSVMINADLKELDGAFVFTGEATTGDCTVSVNGTVKGGFATVVYKRKLSSSLVGTWKLKAGADAIYAHIVTGSPEIDNLIPVLKPMLSGLIWGKVSAVTTYLPANGVFGVSWRTQGAGEDTDLSAIMSIFSIQYCVVDGKFMLALDKNYIDTVAGLAGSKLEELGIPLEEIMKLLVDLGGYYGLPLNMTQTGNDLTMYADKSLIVPAAMIAAPILKPMVPENFQLLLDMALQLLPTAQTLDFGLVLTK